MSELDSQPFPRGVLFAALGLIVAAISLAGIARITNLGTVRSPESTAIESRSLWFEDRSDGAVAVYSSNIRRSIVTAEDGSAIRHEAIAVLEPGTNGFIRSVMRGLARERRQHGAGPEQPFLLTRWANGRLSLEDIATGRRVELDAFGPTNAGAFAAMLDTESVDIESSTIVN